jgi:hypothetical protein
MSSAETESAFRYQITPVTASWIDRHKGALAGNEARERVTGMIQRGAREVLGDELEADVIRHFRHKITGDKYALVGTRAIHHVYAPTVAAIVRGMQWDEGNEQLALLNASVYGRFLSQTIVDHRETGEDVTDLEALGSEMRIAAGRYVQEKGMSEEAVSQVALLTGIFEIKGGRKTNIFAQLRDPNLRGKAFKRLEQIRDTAE